MLKKSELNGFFPQPNPHDESKKTKVLRVK